MLKKLQQINEEYKLTPLQKIFLTTDGSITHILEVLTGHDIKVDTVSQEVVKADHDIAESLGIRRGDEVNLRVVNLIGNGRVLVHAVSYTPLKHLQKKFKNDIIKKNKPIGRILSNLKIEARRELNDLSVEKADKYLADVFNIKYGSLLLWRNYDIVHEGRMLINISEFFPYDLDEIFS